MKTYKNKLKAVAIVCLSLLPFVASAVSFNCNRATKAAEFAVCANYELSQLDDELAEAYHRVASFGCKELKRNKQIDWLKVRNKCKSNVSCLRNRYQERIAWLNDCSVRANYEDIDP